MLGHFGTTPPDPTFALIYPTRSSPARSTPLQQLTKPISTIKPHTQPTSAEFTIYENPLLRDRANSRSNAGDPHRPQFCRDTAMPSSRVEIAVQAIANLGELPNPPHRLSDPCPRATGRLFIASARLAPSPNDMPHKGVCANAIADTGRRQITNVPYCNLSPCIARSASERPPSRGTRTADKMSTR